MASQTQSGKSFEYAIVEALTNLISLRKISFFVVEDEMLETARKHFNSLNSNDQTIFIKGARAGLEHLIHLEPRLLSQTSPEDVLRVHIQSSSTGVVGDPRDVIFSRSLHGWEIGISCKNNHNDLKHSRLSPKIDFGCQWISNPVSDQYWQDVDSIFEKIQSLKERGLKKWNEWFVEQNQTGDDKNEFFVIPVLQAFEAEIKRICLDETAPTKILQYIIGAKDFYQVVSMPQQKLTKILAFNLYGTLNQSFYKKEALIKIQVSKLPTKLVDTAIKNTTMEAYFDCGWTLRFRLHTASSSIESSLKFAIGLIGNPTSAYTNTCLWSESLLNT